jgi:hypothetical protein
MSQAGPIVPVLDHVVINVLTGLDEAVDRYRALGFALTERGHHTLGSSNQLAIFGSNYLELLGFERGNEHKRPELHEIPLGLSGLAFRVTESADLHLRLRALGLDASDPSDFSRPVELPDGTHQARFRTVRLSKEEAPYGRVFFCHHFTPELVWRAQWQQHPNGVTDVAGLTIASNTPDQTADLYRRMFGSQAVRQVASDAYAYEAGRVRMRVVGWPRAQAEYGELAAPADGQPRMVALDLLTRDLGAARAVLEASAIPFKSQTGAVSIAARDCAGVALKFIE